MVSLCSLRSWSVHGPQLAAKVVPRRSSRRHGHNASSGMSVRVLDCKIHAFKHRCTKSGKLTQMPENDKIADVSSHYATNLLTSAKSTLFQIFFTNSRIF